MNKKNTAPARLVSGVPTKAKPKGEAFAQARPMGGAYTQTVIEHFQKPHNYGKMEDPDGVGKVGNTVCGDVMWLYIRVGKTKGKEIIADVKFETFGCVAAIATSSVITDMAKGKILADALAIDKQSIVKQLGGLPPIKLHCSVLAADALAEAIYDYMTKNKRAIPADLEEKHRRISVEKEEIEKKYKDWIDIEEGIQKKC
jgi:nitrogen fixation NifU-like protein